MRALAFGGSASLWWQCQLAVAVNHLVHLEELPVLQVPVGHLSDQGPWAPRYIFPGSVIATGACWWPTHQATTSPDKGAGAARSPQMSGAAWHYLARFSSMEHCCDAIMIGPFPLLPPRGLVAYPQHCKVAIDMYHITT